MDNGTHLSCGDWDDDAIYPTTGCASGDEKMCDKLSAYSNFTSLCNASCADEGSTWGVACYWEVIASLKKSCDTIFDGKPNAFAASFPDTSNDKGKNISKQWDYFLNTLDNKEEDPASEVG